MGIFVQISHDREMFTEEKVIYEKENHINPAVIDDGSLFHCNPRGGHAAGKEPGSTLCMNPAKVKLYQDMRRLWVDHVGWTRSYIVSAIAGLDDQKDVLARC